MKVGIVHNSLNSTGVERLCLKTIESFKEAGYEVILATIDPEMGEFLVAIKEQTKGGR